MIAAHSTDTLRALLADERVLLADAARVLSRIDVPLAHQDAFRDAVAQLDYPFLLVVVGEFNAGKSALINALVGQTLLEEGVTPTTARIAVLQYGEENHRVTTDRGFDVVTASAPLLRDLSIVDTPGTNAVLREHEALTREFVPRADFVLFITSADRPFPESERVFLHAIREWGKPVLVAVNKIDLLETEAERATIIDFVQTHGQALLGQTPLVFPLSARRAARGRLRGDDTEVQVSGLAALEHHVQSTLDDTERLRLKLRNPLGVGDRVLQDAAVVVGSRLDLLQDDFTVVDRIDAQIAVHREDITRDLRFRLADLDTELLEFERRGNAFFDEMLRLGRLPDLLNRSKVAAAFERDAVADLPQRIESRVEAIVQWMAETEARLWKAISEQLARREAAHAEHLAGRTAGPFEANYARLLDGVRREAQRAVETYDRSAEAARLAESVRDAVAGAALLQASALGLGTLVTALASTTVADVTGLLAAGALSVIGFLVLPAKRKSARRDLEERVTRLRSTLSTSLTAKTTEELTASVRRVEGATEPYTRFVRAEHSRLAALRDEIARLRRGVDAMLARVVAA